MKFCSAIRRRGAIAVRRYVTVAVTIAPGVFALMFAAVMVGTSQAQDAGTGDSSWEKIDSVLVLPPVYRPDAAADAGSETADACAEDCASSSDADNSGFPIAVAGTADNPAGASAGTADNPTEESVAVGGSMPDGSQEQQAIAAGDRQSADNLDDSVGSTQDYEEQAARDPGAYGIASVPSVIIGVPIGPKYGPNYGPRTFAPTAPVFAPARSLPTSSSWMPQPMAKVAPLPSIVPRVIPRTVGGFPGGFSGGFHGGFSHMAGFHGGFGHR